MSMVKANPEVRSVLAPYLITRDCPKAIAFYTAAFGATEDFRLMMPSGKVGHAEIRIAGAQVLLADEFPDFGALSPASIGGCPITLHLLVEDADAAVARAVGAGAMLVRELSNEFYGHRAATVADPFGYSWKLSSVIEDVSPAEMQARLNKM